MWTILKAVGGVFSAHRLWISLGLITAAVSIVAVYMSVCYVRGVELSALKDEMEGMRQQNVTLKASFERSMKTIRDMNAKKLQEINDAKQRELAAWAALERVEQENQAISQQLEQALSEVEHEPTIIQLGECRVPDIAWQRLRDIDTGTGTP